MSGKDRRQEMLLRSTATTTLFSALEFCEESIYYHLEACRRLLRLHRLLEMMLLRYHDLTNLVAPLVDGLPMGLDRLLAPGCLAP